MSGSKEIDSDAPTRICRNFNPDFRFPSGIDGRPAHIGPEPEGQGHCLYDSAGVGYEWLTSRGQKGNSREQRRDPQIALRFDARL